MRSCRLVTLLSALALALTCAGCDGLGDGSDGAFPDAGPSDVRVDTVASTWPPQITVASDSQLATPAASVLSFFEGEVTIQLQDGSVDADTQIQMTRTIIRADGEDWVGYTFGDHGLPIDPRAELTLTAPLAWLPPGGTVDPTLGLYRISGLRLGDKLPTASDPVVSGGRFTIVVSFDAFDTFVLATK
ncbi:MAG: hypothetical protein R3F39_19860 [Myxococcota bacterium]